MRNINIDRANFEGFSEIGVKVMATDQCGRAELDRLAYATTKEVMQNCMGGLAQMLVKKGITSTQWAPGPIWTPGIPSTMPEEAVRNFGEQVPMRRAGRPAELAPQY
jgi:NAD(P)-dependent dehydrogenase (short-subunit alcohol dehydrogenase family)